MTTKQYLMQIIKLSRMIEDRIDDLDELRVLAENISSKRPVSDLVISSGSKDRIEKLIADIIDTENDLRVIVKKYLDKRRTITSQIEDDCLSVEEYRVLRLRYINGYIFPKILEEMNKDDIQVSESTMYRTHNRAIEKFEKRFGQTYK